jgi:adenine-specific DNA-methyltransferase
MPPRKTKTAKPASVEAITHEEKRANLPTVDAQDFISPEVEKPVQARYPRDPTLDPQLVWKGKDQLDGDDLVADAPPIYIQEKIDPRVLVENLRATAGRASEEPELTLFDTFDGLSGLDSVEFYTHEANWSNRMILGDSLNVMASLVEREALRGKVQMIYLDPPYGIKFGSNWQTSIRKPRVSDGKLTDATREVEQIKAFRDTWELGINTYLTYLRDRLVVARDLLTETGSCFVQIGEDNVHLVRAVLDEVFESQNFCVEIAYQKTTGAGSPNEVPKMFPAVWDRILWYAKNKNVVKYRQLYKTKQLGGSGVSLYTRVRMPDGSIRPLTAEERATGEVPDGARVFGVDNLTSASGVDKTRYPVTIDGRIYTPNPGVWKTDQAGMDRLIAAGRIYAGSGQNLGYIRYIDDFPASPLVNLWTDTVGQNQYGGSKVYVVQTALKAAQRCILACTDPGDLVIDPTCGSGTTAFVAEQWGRRWITVDTSRVALAIARERLIGARFPFFIPADSPEGRKLVESPNPQLSDIEGGNDSITHGFAYESVQHITLKSIANNPDIKEGMTAREVDEAIKEHADFELLYDKPHEDKKKTRVAGPFTVEGLSPHRSLLFSGSAVDAAGASNAKGVPASLRGDVSFEQTILSNLRTAGIQNGRSNERLMFDLLESYAATYVQAIGIREDVMEGTPKRVGIAIGPQYGTVGPGFIKDAAREALASEDVDMLCVLAFAFDPAVLAAGDDYVASEDGFANVAAERRLGRVPVLLVRMNADLVMGEELKKTGAGNLFTVFGEPDIEIASEGDDLRVILRGIDVYDPNTGEIRSNDTDQVALWMIDTSYNGESFFVRHCYFTGGQDPYTRLKRALKADIDEEAWATLYSTESRPFARPESGKIAVKVINDYGDEVMKVFNV